ncbi:citrate lyase subunit alpha/citrate CoA-transferase [Sulfitobacter guttiformis]|uniref:Citrate lyase subunit alpha/citrate CoA-transferase n=2 Tax=Sulfitobacter guttiformis TaxID=74349 RepID=A0A420DU27_9RHOB|nr:citrate lyase subunit alpha/citrate CoA-transferase [Sulfitobacter guttiformis]
MDTETQSGRMAALDWPVITSLGAVGAAPQATSPMQPTRPATEQTDKRLADLGAAFDTFDICDGAVLSFHHHYRNGDRLINAVLEEAARRGLRGLTIAPSSLFPVHVLLGAHIQSGVIGNVITDYAKGPVTDAMLSGALRSPLLLQSHGGRARALGTGALKVDVAFVGAPIAQADGACTGRGGTLPCGPLGYAMVDAGYARRTVICAHEITGAPLAHTDIPAAHVDAVVPFAHPGAVEGIASDTTLPAQTPQAQQIATLVAQVIAAAGVLRDGFSLQTGAGGFSLAAVPVIGAAMAQAGVRGSFVSGGITGAHVALQQAGLFARLHDVQCFDGAAVASSITNPDHFAMSASQYANPLHTGPIVNDLSVMVLGAVEVDRHFNINVTLGGDGRLIGGPGGHPDAAQGAQLTIVTTGLVAGGFAKLVEHVRCVTTSGKHVDVLVTDDGIAVHPKRPDLARDLEYAGLPVKPFEALMQKSALQASRARIPAALSPRLLIEDRSGGVLDWA